MGRTQEKLLVLEVDLSYPRLIGADADLVVRNPLGAPDRSRLSRLRRPQRPGRHDLEDPEFVRVVDGEHLTAVIEAIAEFLGQRPHELDGFTGCLRALHGDEGEHGDVEGRSRGVVVKLADAADGRFADAQLLVVHVPEHPMMVAVSMRNLRYLQSREVVLVKVPFESLLGRPGLVLVDVVDLACLSGFVVGGGDVAPGPVADAAVTGVSGHGRSVNRGPLGHHDNRTAVPGKVLLGRIGRQGLMGTRQDRQPD